jgi:hypothetical protein
MTCPLSALRKMVERALSIGLLLAAGMSDDDVDDPLASPIALSVPRQQPRPPRALSA